ncbi:MAG: FHA domain-containing protein, partial [Planctomycetota bacterium]
MFRMIIKDSTGTIKKFKINKDQILIGRDKSCDIAIPEKAVSTKHALLRKVDKKVIIEDVGSRNGVLVNGLKIQGPSEITDEDVISVGSFNIWCELLEEETLPAGPAYQSPFAQQNLEKQKEEEAATGMKGFFSYLVVFLEPIKEFLKRDDVSEIMINGPDQIYIETGGKLVLTDAKFKNDEAVQAAVMNIAQSVGRIVNEKNPRLDARLPDGSRIHAILPPVARNGTYISIRKFMKKNMTIEKLIEFGSLTKKAAKFIEICVKLERNIIVTGGTGSGKTSLLNIISSFIPPTDRVLVIEDASELQLRQPHVLPLETKHPDKHGEGAVTIRDLLHSSLRMRPDRIVVGECRGAEALDMIQALNTGHGGSMSTVHSNSPRDSLSRLETMCLMAGVDMPLSAIRGQIASAIDIIIYTNRFHDGSRKITHITEVLPLSEDGKYVTSDIFRFERGPNTPDGKITGKLLPTGNLPSFLE